MMTSELKQSVVQSRGFTLLEVLVATAIFSVLVGALYALFYGALRARESTYESIVKGLPTAYALSTVRRDLANMTAPTGLFAGAVIGEIDEQDTTRLDTIEFFTTSGVVRANEPWGDIQKVSYYLSIPEGDDASGSYFVRAVTRNLLASTTEDPPEERLLPNVESLTLAYYDGESWQDSWDSTTQENVAPEAVKMRLDFMKDTEGRSVSQPVEVVLPVTAGLSTDSEGAEQP